MKNRMMYLLCAFMLTGFMGKAQEKKTETFKVFGNCDMCKETIEGSLKKKEGIISKRWDKNTKLLEVTFDASKITIEQIGKKVAGAGYDNQYATATDVQYKGLHSCCQYKRPEKK